jgi:hypothetical protein
MESFSGPVDISDRSPICSKILEVQNRNLHGVTEGTGGEDKMVRDHGHAGTLGMLVVS